MRRVFRVSAWILLLCAVGACSGSSTGTDVTLSGDTSLVSETSTTPEDALISPKDTLVAPQDTAPQPDLIAPDLQLGDGSSDSATLPDTQADAPTNADLGSPDGDAEKPLCVKKGNGQVPGLVATDSKAELVLDQQYSGHTLCDPFVIDFYKFKASITNTYEVTVFHSPVDNDVCFLAGVMTDPHDAENTLSNLTKVDFKSDRSVFTYSLNASANFYYVSVMKLSPCDKDTGVPQNAVYGISVGFAP